MVVFLGFSQDTRSSILSILEQLDSLFNDWGKKKPVNKDLWTFFGNSLAYGGLIIKQLELQRKQKSVDMTIWHVHIHFKF